MRKQMIGTTLTVCVTFLPFQAWAATITVRADGSGNYTTIQAGINGARNGDTVVVSPGLYRENISFLGKRITLTGEQPQNPNVVAATIIDGGNAGSVVTFAGSEGADTLLTGFTITNGYASNGGGVRGNGARATIRYCAITGNEADWGGGVQDVDGLIEHCTISANHAEGNGGGLESCGGSIVYSTIANNTAAGYGGGLHYCPATILNCTISGNDAGGYGGGLSECQGAIADCTIANNQARGSFGGGLHYCNGPIDRCTVVGNNAGDQGGGFNACGGTIRSCIVERNRAGLWGGGGFSSCSGELRDNIVRENYAELFGGGLLSCSANIIGCRIEGNQAGEGGGGFRGCNALIEGCTITGNSAGGRGGGLEYCNGTINNCLIAGNLSSWGGGLHNCDGTVDNCTIAENHARQYGGGLRDCDWIVSNSILYGNTRGNLFTPQRDEFSNSSPPVYSCIRGGGGGIGSIVCDLSPFVGDGGWIWDGADFVWNVGEYHLWPGAACIDAGNNRSVARDTLDLDQDGDVQERTPFDLSGGRRFADDPCSADSGVSDPPGYPAIVDMGAYEYRPFDGNGDGKVDLRDFARFQTCFTGDGEGPISWECSYFDVDCDGDIDVTDFAGLRQVLQGP